jgi:hypothetical protein
MALISESHAVAAEDQHKFWEDNLTNTRILLFELDKIILALTQEEKKSFSMNTGKSTVNVTRQDLPSLIDRREKLQKQIEYLEDKLGISQVEEKFKMRQGIPAW